VDNSDYHYLIGRIQDLCEKTYREDYLTHTDFLSVSEIAVFYDMLRQSGENPAAGTCRGVPYVVWGGWEDAERCCICFLPTWMDKETFLAQEMAAPQVAACLEIKPVSLRFADELSHRDFLGALMHLGIERSRIGDILTDSQHAFIFVSKDMAELITDDLTRVKHTTVMCRSTSPSECDIRPSFEELQGSVASERLDAILAMACRISRTKAQTLVTQELVYVDGRTASSASMTLPEGARVSVRGYGKFIYDGIQLKTRKDRLMVRIRKFV